MAAINHNYGGADVTWNSVSAIHGRHFNIGNFTINAEITVTNSVGATVGDTLEGSLVIEANSITINDNCFIFLSLLILT